MNRNNVGKKDSNKINEFCKSRSGYEGWIEALYDDYSI